jgi:hypothetical protein
MSKTTREQRDRARALIDKTPVLGSSGWALLAACINDADALETAEAELDKLCDTLKKYQASERAYGRRAAKAEAEVERLRLRAAPEAHSRDRGGDERQA